MNEINKSVNFDYKTSNGPQRGNNNTAFYREQIELPEQTFVPKLHDFPKDYSIYLPHTGEDKQDLTENPNQFVWKTFSEKENKFLKSFEKSHFRDASKYMLPLSSVSRRDYQWKSKAFEEDPPAIYLPTAIKENKNLMIDRHRPSYGVLLDPSTTTNNLAFRKYSKEELPTRDVITFWNWKTMIPKRKAACSVSPIRSQHINSFKYVPNNGLTTETRSNYVHCSNTKHVGTFYINNQLTNCSGIGVQNTNQSENTIYGSGTRMQKYIA